jgi:hypothetical protein
MMLGLGPFDDLFKTDGRFREVLGAGIRAGNFFDAVPLIKRLSDRLELMLRRTGELAQRLQHVTPTPTLPVAVRLYVQHELIPACLMHLHQASLTPLGWSGGTPGG